MTDLGSWFTSHLGLIIGVAVAVLALLLIVVAVIAWIGSRATFVYIEDVASGRAELKRPWGAHAERANSYFAWRFGLAAALLASVALVVILAILAALLIARGGPPGAALGALLLIGLVPLFLIVLVAGGLAAMALRDFVAPLQIHERTSCGPAVSLVMALVRAHPVPFILYVVLKVAFGVAQGFLLLLAACFTLCCILLPVVTQTVLQPLFYFERAWSLYLLRQMGYDLIGGAGEEAGP